MFQHVLDHQQKNIKTKLLISTESNLEFPLQILFRVVKMESHLPYRVEYFSDHYQVEAAWIGNCRLCKKGFSQGQLRLAAKVQVGIQEILRNHQN
jgi:hypothetical protein